MITNQYVNKISIKKTITLYKWEKYKIFYNFILFRESKEFKLEAPFSHISFIPWVFFSLPSFYLKSCVLNNAFFFFFNFYFYYKI